MELDERSRTETRTVAAEAPELLEMATKDGFEAIGMTDVWEDTVYLNANDPSVAGGHDEFVEDAAIFGATPRAVDKVVIAGETIVKDGVHVCYEEACRGYRETLRKLSLI